ncbi:LIC_10190 family membrane protein [Prochlorothrix hollandica]|uniref:LIC_10190 family membrane protein n=1 Tax=Prochlorothrix hollandica TaxID=1223 RepID=UPI00034A7E95|nr:hypothetical protein [Prochlorothrix hollandica]
MIFNIIFFPLFILAFVSLGSFFFEVIVKFTANNKPINQIDLGLTGFLGLFFTGLLNLTFNFFAPLNSPILLILIFIGIVLGVKILVEKRDFSQSLRFNSLFAVSVILAPLAGTMGVGYDGGLYHLPHQLWLRNESIVIGLANFHGRFGFGSLLEYISSPLWLGNNFILLSYLQVSFLVFFSAFLINQVIDFQGRSLTLSIGIIVSLLSLPLRDYVLQGYTYTDLPAGISFASTFLYGWTILNKQNQVFRNEYLLLFILGLSAFFYKSSCVLIALWCLFVVMYRIFYHKKGDTLYECINAARLPLFILAIWIFKNLIMTGCLLYPASSSCLNLDWSSYSNALNDSNWITAWARHPSSGLYSLEDSSWFLSWWLPHYSNLIKRLTVSGLIVGLFYLLIHPDFRSFSRLSGNEAV